MFLKFKRRLDGILAVSDIEDDKTDNLMDYLMEVLPYKRKSVIRSS